MDGFRRQALSWDAYLSSVLEEDTPAGLFELEALTQRFYLRAAMCCPETQKMEWVGEPHRQQRVLLFWRQHWTLLP
eukprot:12314776-Prorocentrum_lima.AAC.1